MKTFSSGFVSVLRTSSSAADHPDDERWDQIQWVEKRDVQRAAEDASFATLLRSSDTDVWNV